MYQEKCQIFFHNLSGFATSAFADFSFIGLLDVITDLKSVLYFVIQISTLHLNTCFIDGNQFFPYCIFDEADY